MVQLQLQLFYLLTHSQVNLLKLCPRLRRGHYIFSIAAQCAAIYIYNQLQSINIIKKAKLFIQFFRFFISFAAAVIFSHFVRLQNFILVAFTQVFRFCLFVQGLDVVYTFVLFLFYFCFIFVIKFLTLSQSHELCVFKILTLLLCPRRGVSAGSVYLCYLGSFKKSSQLIAHSKAVGIAFPMSRLCPKGIDYQLFFSKKFIKNTDTCKVFVQ